MFCSNCGCKIDDNSKFCMNCGKQIIKAESSINVPIGTKLVSAKCTSCGASVNVNPNSEIAKCPFCGNNYIVEKAINMFNITNGNFNIDNATINVIVTNDKNNFQSNERDPFFAEAGRLVIEKQKASVGMLQRMFKVGFNRAGRIMDQLYNAGVVGNDCGTKPRRILMNIYEFNAYLKEHNM